MTQNINPKNNNSIHELFSPDKNSNILVSDFGGQVLKYTNNKKEILYYQQLNPRRSGMPILFPFAGPLKDNTLDFTNTKFPQHGFGRDVVWQIYEKKEDQNTEYNSISLILTYEDLPSIWQKAYPFPFMVIVHYYLSNTKLSTEMVVLNPIQEDLQIPIKPGFHPYFALPNDNKSQIIVNQSNKIPKSIDWQKPSNGYFFKDQKQKNSLILGQNHITTTTTHKIFKLSNPDNFYNLDINNLLVFWSEVGENFVCIEPITGSYNSINYNPILVQKGQGYQFCYTIEVK